MRYATVFVALAVQILLPTSARLEPADDQRLSAEFHDCMDRSAGVTASMRTCMASEQERLEASLNEVYRDLMSSMPDGEAKETLRNSERAWIAHREAQCAFEGSQQESGTLKPVLVAGCWLKETANRLDVLRQRRNFERVR